MKTKVLIMLVVGVLLAFNSGTQAVTMDWVTVGNAGNANDDTGYGGVSDVYQIGKYEVTAGQYAEFLNAVADTDTYGLYKASMWSSSYGCKIQRSSSSGSYSYSIASDWANRPVNYVDWYDGLRFANWLHNGQPTGGQTAATTEDGAYDMSLGSNVVRKPGAKAWLPSENEWYKAAYYKGGGTNAGYWDYPTGTDSTPSNDLIDPDPGNNANFGQSSGYTIGSPYYRTEVGDFENSASPYGTFDQGGNIQEWNETKIGSFRGLRGGSWRVNDFNLESSRRYYDAPIYDYDTLGFRVASVPEPTTLLLLGLGGLALRRKHRAK